jgi:hypothetical protein
MRIGEPNVRASASSVAVAQARPEGTDDCSRAPPLEVGDTGSSQMRTLSLSLARSLDDRDPHQFQQLFDLLVMLMSDSHSATHELLDVRPVS